MTNSAYHIVKGPLKRKDPRYSYILKKDNCILVILCIEINKKVVRQFVTCQFHK